MNEQTVIFDSSGLTALMNETDAFHTQALSMTKILTDPFHDLKLYYKAPLFLMRGELIDPGLDILEHTPIQRHA